MNGERPGDRLQRFSELVMNIILLGFFWTLTSLGVVTVGASCAALNESMRSCLVEKDRQPLKTYFRSFKANFRVSTLVWLIHLLVLAVLALDLLYYSVGDSTGDSVAMAAVCVLLTMLVFELSVVFACIVQYRLTSVKRAFAKSFDFAFRCFRESLEMLFITATVLVAGLFLFRGILPFAAGIITCLNWKILPGAFRRYLTRTPATKQAEAKLGRQKEK